MTLLILSEKVGLLLGGALFPVAIGLGSSFTHCAGMCGPIHYFLVSKVNAGSSIWMFHLGRILGYGTMGAILGFLGHLFYGLSSPWFKFTSGIMLIILFLVFGLGLLGWLPTMLSTERTVGRLFPGRLFQKISQLKPSKKILFPAGLLASLLPCPSTHAVMLWSLALGNVWKSTFAMVLLGIATLPIFITLSFKVIVRPIWMGKIYHVILGFTFLGFSAWRIYGLATQGSASCH
jgi:uncharacterized protein